MKAKHSTGTEVRRGEAGSENPNDPEGPELENQREPLPEVGLLIRSLLGFTSRAWMLSCGSQGFI